jgi:hypothetical protein
MLGFANPASRRRIVAGLSTAVLTVGLLVATAGPAQAGGPSPDPEKYSTTPVGWGHLTGTPAEINAWADRYAVRIIDVAVAGANLFSVTGVANVGIYQRGVVGSQSWLFDETWPSLSAKLGGKRLLNMARYVVDGGVRYAAAIVDDPEDNHHLQQVWLNATPSYLDSKIAAFNGRVADIHPAEPGRYNAVLIKNEGVDKHDSWWYPAKTPDEIAALLKANKARLVDMEPDGPGKFAVVMARNAGVYWWWLVGVDFAAVLKLQAQSGARYIHVKPYQEGGNTRYVVLYLDDLDPVSVKARNALWDAIGDNDAAFGFYLKRVNGTVHNALQADKAFEPASMIKMLFHLHTMRLAYLTNNTNPSLDENLTWYKNPNGPANGGWCAYEDDGTPITTMPVTDALDSVLQGMMQQSDNRKTDAIFSKYGRTAFNDRADWLGMTNTTVHHRPGCNWNAPDVVAASNELTLVDHGKMLEAVLRPSNPILGTGFYRTTFLDLSAHNTGTFAAVVTEEAAKLGKSPQVADDFYDALHDAYKPGGYANAAPGAVCDQDGHCDKLLLRSTGGGSLSLPVKSGGNTIYRDFVYGTFVDGVFDCTVDIDCVDINSAYNDARTYAMREMLRPHIASALATW